MDDRFAARALAWRSAVLLALTLIAIRAATPIAALCVLAALGMLMSLIIRTRRPDGGVD